MNEQGEGRTGWPAGAGDRIVGPALNAILSRPAHAWTLEELAHDAGTSRSVSRNVSIKRFRVFDVGPSGEGSGANLA
jgi:hypothetical protein